MGLQAYLTLAAALFAIGLFGVVTRRNTIGILLGIELMLNAVNINLVAFARFNADPAGFIFTVFTMRIAAAIGFLQMKRWGHQWMIITCWMGVVIWCGYVFNMTMFADVRFAGVVLPVIGWWLYDIFYITPFLAIPYLHSVNREIFSD